MVCEIISLVYQKLLEMCERSLRMFKNLALKTWKVKEFFDKRPENPVGILFLLGERCKQGKVAALAGFLTQKDFASLL